MPLPVPIGRQFDVVHLPATGHLVVLGTAGSGKTTMALHRAASLADPATMNSGPTLLLTYNRSLRTYLNHLATDLGDVQVETYAQFARGYLASQGRMSTGAIAGPTVRRAVLAAAVAERARIRGDSTGVFRAPLGMWEEELAWLQGRAVASEAEYLAVPRIWDGQQLSSAHQHDVWGVWAQYKAGLTGTGHLYDWHSLPAAALDALDVDQTPRRYRHIVLDESQDLSPAAVRSLAKALPPEGSLTLFGDYAQQIYGRRASWREFGLESPAVEIFAENYRNTKEIAELAIRVAEMPHFQDSADIVRPTAPVAAGTKPTLVRLDSLQAEVELVKDRARAIGRTARVAVLARTWALAQTATAGLSNVTHLHDDLQAWDDDPGIFAGTYHSGKGLEFDAVILPFVGSNSVPEREVVISLGRQEAMARESRLLYVGITRARSELLLTYQGDLTAVLPPTTDSVWS